MTRLDACPPMPTKAACARKSTICLAVLHNQKILLTAPPKGTYPGRLIDDCAQ